MANTPELGSFANDFGELAKSGWFMKVGVCAKMISAENILLLAGGGKDNDRDDMAIGMSAEPLENLKAAAAGHFEVGDEEAGKWKPGAIAVFAFALEVIDSVLAVRAGVNGIVKAVLQEGALEQQDIIGIILGDQYGQATVHPKKVRRKMGF